MNNVVPMHPGHDRPLPANEAAEQALLGAILVRNAVLDDIAGFLEPEHFHFAGHGAIYAACLSLRDQGREADAVSLMSALDGDEAIEALPGGTTYLCDLQASVVSLINAPDYARLIHDLHLRRGLIGLGQEIAASGFTTDIEVSAADQAEDAAQRLAALIDAGALPTAGPRPIGEAVERTITQLTNVYEADGAVVGQPTGLAALDRMIGGLQPPSLVVLAARPGMGKTALALNIARHVAEQGGPVAFYSLEMSRPQLVQRLIAGPARVPVDRQRGGPLSRAEYLHLVEASQEVGRLPLLIDDGQSRSVAAMRAHARRLKRRGGLALVVVDYLQLMVSGSPQYRVQEVSDISRELKRLAADVDAPVLAVSQLSRQVEQRDDKRPQLSDLRDSGSIEQDADQVLFIYRDEYYLRRPKQRANQKGDSYMHDLAVYDERKRAVGGLAEILIPKNRHGRTGTVACLWDGAAQAFSDRGEDHGAQEEFL